MKRTTLINYFREQGLRFPAWARAQGQPPFLQISDRTALCNSGRIVDLGDGFLVRERTPEEAAQVNAAILAEFNGCNHVALAHDYHVSIQWVYRLVRQAQREAEATARLASVQNADQVLWVAPVMTLDCRFWNQVVPPAVETAKAQGRLDQLALALISLRPEPLSAAPADNPPAATAPAETQPGTPAPAGNPPADPSGPQSDHQATLPTHGD